LGWRRLAFLTFIRNFLSMKMTRSLFETIIYVFSVGVVLEPVRKYAV